MARALSHYNNVRSTFSSLSKPNQPLPPPSCSHKPTMVTMTRNQSYWSSLQGEVEAHLKAAIPIRPPLDVFEPMYHLAFAAPATKAPGLCLAACELVGGNRHEAMAAASAMHLMHSAAHVHEHLPLTDRPVKRPVTQHGYGPNIELLTGDGLVPFGFELLARSLGPARENPDRILRVIIEIARAFGSKGVVDGQYEESMMVQGVRSDGGELGDGAWAEYVCRKKEGEMHACAGACGAILGGGSDEEIERLRVIGLYVGMMEGLVSRVGISEKGILGNIEKYRELALNELESFNGRNAEALSSLLESYELSIV